MRSLCRQHPDAIGHPRYGQRLFELCRHIGNKAELGSEMAGVQHGETQFFGVTGLVIFQVPGQIEIDLSRGRFFQKIRAGTRTPGQALKALSPGRDEA